MILGYNVYIKLIEGKVRKLRNGCENGKEIKDEKTKDKE